MDIVLAGRSWELAEAQQGSNPERQALAAEKLETGDWLGFVLVHPRPLRLKAFVQIADRMKDDAAYWSILSTVWTDAECPGTNKPIWVSLFSADRPGRENLMTSEERGTLESLPDSIQIFRGCLPAYRSGLSWTLNREKAAWFARRIRGKVYSHRILKTGVLAYFNERDEAEILAA